MKTSTQKKILIVDDHPVLREGLGGLINSHEDLEVCGGAESAQEALRVIEDTEPDLAIVDLSLVGSNGLELIKDIRVRWPRLPVLVLSMHEEELYAERALRAGARGYITKQEATNNIITAIQKILQGDVYLSGGMTSLMLERVTGHLDSEAADLNRLSDRELQVFELIGAGKTTRDIADELSLSVRTIETYKDHIKTKLELKNSTELVKRAALWAQKESG